MRRTVLTAVLAAAALFAATPTFAQGFGVQVGPFGFGVGPDYYYGPDYHGPSYYTYNPGYAYTYSAPAPLYEGRSVASDTAYCQSHFRSYNPATGMYLGFDGQYHPCP